MKGQTNQSVIENALQKKLRKRMTDAENRLWRRLRSRQIAGFKFRRQHPFLDYVLDFVCLESQLVVEVDGGQHEECEQDAVRDRRLNEAGFRVLRFWNNQVLQETDAVVEEIWSALNDGSEKGNLPIPTPALPLKGREASALWVFSPPPSRGKVAQATFAIGGREGNGGRSEHTATLPQPKTEAQ